jgi:hypothetical protein
MKREEEKPATRPMNDNVPTVIRTEFKTGREEPKESK